MAVSACEDGSGQQWQEGKNGRVGGRGILNEDAESTSVPRSLGDPFRAVINPEELAKHYTRFRVTERILLTGHSHQAWPDVAFEAQQQAWLDTAKYVDDVWEKAFEQAGTPAAHCVRLLDDSPDRMAL